jgi:hypothetical protein
LNDQVYLTMTALTVLADEQVRLILEGLTLDQLDEFRTSLSTALRSHSDSEPSADEWTHEQPSRISVYNPQTSATTLFMPSIYPAGIGVKGKLWLGDQVNNLVGGPNALTVVTLSTPLEESQQRNNRPAAPVIKPTGAITLLSPSGSPTALLHAATLTAFRTALASSCLLARRRNVRVLAVFGTGSQAYWHVRLALKMHGRTVRKVCFVVRQLSDAARDTVSRYLDMPSEVKSREGWAGCRFELLSPEQAGHEVRKAECLKESDAVICCTPASGVLFDADVLDDRKGRLVVAVGSYAPGMRELPRALLVRATNAELEAGGLEGGVIVVDTLEGAMTEAGEIIEAKIPPSKLVT